MGNSVSGQPWITRFQLKKDARRGDIIEIRRGTHSHFVLWLGIDSQVLHVVREGLTETGLVQQSHFDTVCGISRYVSIANFDQFAETNFAIAPRRPEVIVAVALSYKGKSVDYEMFLQNSQYYCTLWRFGRGFSNRHFGRIRPMNLQWFQDQPIQELLQFEGSRCNECDTSPICVSRYVCAECDRFELCTCCKHFGRQSHASDHAFLCVENLEQHQRLLRQFAAA